MQTVGKMHRFQCDVIRNDQVDRCEVPYSADSAFHQDVSDGLRILAVNAYYAYVDLFVEALADAAVACGLYRKDAIGLAAQMVLVSAKLILESGKHPGELKDAVCSPGGTTIQGVRALESRAFRSAVMEAVFAAYNA